MLLTKKKLYKIRNSKRQTQRKMKKGGRKRRRKYRRRRSFRRRRKPLNLRKRSLKNIQKGGGKTKFFSVIPLTEGEKKYTTTRGTYDTITSNILVKVEIEASKEFQTVVDILKSIITLRSPLLSEKDLLRQSLTSEDGESILFMEDSIIQALQEKKDNKNRELDGEGGLRRQWNNLGAPTREAVVEGIPDTLKADRSEVALRTVREIKQAIRLKKRVDEEEKKVRKWSQQINMVANFNSWLDDFSTLFETNRQIWINLAREQKTLPSKLESIYLHWKNPTQRKIELLQKQEEEMETFPRYADTRKLVSWEEWNSGVYKKELKLRHAKQIKHLDEKIKMEKQILTRALQSRIDLEKIKPFSCCTAPEEEDEGKVDAAIPAAIPAALRAVPGVRVYERARGEHLDDFITITITPLVLTGLESSMQNFSEKMIQFTKEESDAWMSWGRDKAIKKWKALEEKFDIPTDLPISVVEPDSYVSPFAFFVMDLDCGENIDTTKTSPREEGEDDIPVNPETASKLKQKRLRYQDKAGSKRHSDHEEEQTMDIHPVMLGSQIHHLNFWDFVKLCLNVQIKDDILDDFSTARNPMHNWQDAFPIHPVIVEDFRDMERILSISFNVINKDDKQIIEPQITWAPGTEEAETSNPTNTIMRYIFNKENSPNYRIETMLFRQLGIDNTRPVYIRQIELISPPQQPISSGITNMSKKKFLGPVLMPVPETMDDDEFARAIPDLTDTDILPRPIEEGDMTRVKDNYIHSRELEIAQEKTEDKTKNIGRGSWATTMLTDKYEKGGVKDDRELESILEWDKLNYMYKDYGIQDEQKIIIALKSVSKQNAEYEVFTYSIPEGAIKGYNAMENPFLTLDTKFIRRMKSSVLSSKENKSHLKYLRRMVIVPGKDDLLREQLEIKTIKFSENMARDKLIGKTQQILDTKEEDVDVIISTLRTVPTLFWSSPVLAFQFPILSDESKYDSEIPFSGFYKGVICMTHATIPDELMREVFNNINISEGRKRDVREVDKGLFQYTDTKGNVIEMSEDARKKLEKYQDMKPTRNEIIKKVKEESDELIARARKLRAEGSVDEAQELESQAEEMVKVDNMKERYIKEQKKWIKGKRVLELQIHETDPLLLERMLEQICPYHPEGHQECLTAREEYESGQISHDEYFGMIRILLNAVLENGTISAEEYNTYIEDLARLETRYKMKKQQRDVSEFEQTKRNEQQLNRLEEQRRGIEGKIKKETEKKDKAIMEVEIQLEKAQKQADMDSRARNEQIDTLLGDKIQELQEKIDERDEAEEAGQDDAIITEMSKYIETLKNDIQALETEKTQSEEKLNKALDELESKSREDTGKITQEYNENKKVKKAIQEIKQIRKEEADIVRVEGPKETVAAAKTVDEDEDADLAEELGDLPTWEDAEDAEDEELAGMVVGARRRGDEPPPPREGRERRPTKGTRGTKRADDVDGGGDDTDTDEIGDAATKEDDGERRKTDGLPPSEDGLPAGTKRIIRPWYNKIPSMTHEWYFLRPSQDDMTGQIDLRSAVDMDINTSSWLAGLGQPIDSLAPEDDISSRGEEFIESGGDSARRSGSARGDSEEDGGRSDDRGDDSARGTSSSTAEVVDVNPPETPDVIEAQVVDEPDILPQGQRASLGIRLNKINEKFQGLKDEINRAIKQANSAINDKLVDMKFSYIIVGKARERIVEECLEITNKMIAWTAPQQERIQKAFRYNDTGKLTENDIKDMEDSLFVSIPKVRADIEKLSNLTGGLTRTSNL